MVGSEPLDRLRCWLPAWAESPYLYAHTAARMDRSQLRGVLDRKVRSTLVPALPVDFDERYEQRIPSDLSPRVAPFRTVTDRLRDCLDDTTRRAYRSQAVAAADGCPTFLNSELSVGTDDGVDWYDERLDDLPRLWRLQLYGFVPHRAAVLGYGPDADPSAACLRRLDAWLRDWTATIEIGGPDYLRRAWTPYAVSLRLQHWSRYLSWRTARGEGWALAPDLARELYKNALFLAAHVEQDVGGNHLIENGAALVAAGVFFPDHGTRFRDAGLSLLRTAATEQFLGDGCHYERSPMYHVRCLKLLLGVCDLLDAVDERIPAPLRRTASEAAGFLRWLRPPDDRLPLLNDAVRGETVPLQACLRYAEAVDSVEPSGLNVTRPTDGGRPATESGYRWLRTDTGALLIDGGPVGPPHLPGHAHSDTLSVLLWLDGQPVVTDTGSFGYESGERRQYARGVRGHGTVQVDDTEPIPLGGRFLMGPRPDPEARLQDGPVSLFEGRYRARPFAAPRYVHHRGVFAGDRWWLIQDTVQHADGRPVRARYPLDPAIETEQTGTGLALHADGELGALRPLGATSVGVRDGRYFPRFGVSVRRSVVEMTTDDGGGDLTTIRVLIGPPAAGEDAGMAVDGPLPKQLTVAGETYRLPRPVLLPE